MRIIRLQAEGFMRLVAVDITPEGNLIEVRGKNEQGKSSLLGAIFAALAGAAAAPVKPVRKGEEYAIIRTTLGDKEPELIVTRYFGEDGTTSLKVENADGASYGKAQTMLDALVGTISFDPLAFARMEPAAQAAELRRLVKLEVDLDELAAKDKADYDERTIVNRDGKQLKARIEAIPIYPDLPEKRPDRAALLADLGKAAETNSGIERDRAARQNEDRFIHDRSEVALQKRNEAERLRAQAKELDDEAEGIELEVTRRRGVLDGMDALPDPVDTDALQEQIRLADVILARMDEAATRATLQTEFDGLKAKSEGLTSNIVKRETTRQAALAKAEMPVEGLSLETVDGVLIVTLDGVPFSQASSAQQLKVSTKIAMAANPRLKVLRIKEGSLLDEDNLKLLAEMAKDADYQIWAEFVGAEGAGIVMEAGEVKGATKVERVEPPKRRKKGDKDEEGGPEAEGGDPAPEKRKPRAFDEMTTRPAGQLDLGEPGK